MTKASEYVKHMYSLFEGRAPLMVGMNKSFNKVYPFVYENNKSIPLGLVGIAANNESDPTEVQLYHISAFKIKKGHGSEIMKFICKNADEFGVSLYAQAEVQFSDKESLIQIKGDGTLLIHIWSTFNLIPIHILFFSL